VVSVIVPVFNGSHFLPRCLDAIERSSFRQFEIIVVDDASNDDSAAISQARGAHVVSLPVQGGPGGARNRGALEAQGGILFFVDADVVIHPDAMARVAADLASAPTLAAVFGSYDDSPAEASFISQYKNLYHHFTHQQASPNAATFWAGCGAIRRDVFLASGGFDQLRYPRPSIEDIELGYRMRRMGHRILLDKKLQGKHLKCWTFISLLRADILCRAVPWSRLILDSQSIVNDLNLKISERVSAALVVLAVALLPLLVYQPGLVPVWLATLGMVVGLNHKLYRFFARHRGVWFAGRVLPLHCLYYLYSTGAFVWCWGARVLTRRRGTGIGV
jgi:Glycosyl transferase family 2